MIIETTRFGSLEYETEQVITFISGIPGFKQFQRYTIVSIEESPFQYLQSVEEGSLAFIIVSPFDFINEYEFELSEQIKDELRIESAESLQIYSIVRVTEDLASATINLAAPIIINTACNYAVQYILSNDHYSVQYPLFAEGLPTGGE
ncbi:flagellar assembly factor FliW [Paenibacillus algorifonticola]|uniref:Flagellar assembly factor FliW n=1 Tax=Paenibacillus algorifonticola TaxID=684063 RepID=A0A1I2IVC6_9BACL|nr:flagellar assembly protein FliW [Paenibacillus algorifonticola]SFF38612.1 flagellar assembly factor FliW [Paenibacillus algorifonticola]SFF46234.1 flagellar assembly factor FliW [Paenibacillus algorifonticola]